MLGGILKVWAAIYTLAGVAAVVAFVLPSAGSLSAVFAIMMGLPWTLFLPAWEPDPGGTMLPAMALVTGAILVNAGVVWWSAGVLAQSYADVAGHMSAKRRRAASRSPGPFETAPGQAGGGTASSLSTARK